jgi:hypothetical protein
MAVPDSRDIFDGHDAVVRVLGWLGLQPQLVFRLQRYLTWLMRSTKLVLHQLPFGVPANGDEKLHGPINQTC